MLLLVSFATAKSQTRVLYPEDRTNRIFLSALSSGITYATTYALFNRNNPKPKHGYPILATIGVNMALGAISYSFDKTSNLNKRQNVVGWIGGSLVTITIIRIGLN